MNRRQFLETMGATSVAVALGPVLASAPEDRLGTWSRAAAARELSEHRLVKMEARHVGDRYSHWVGPNARGRPAGWGPRYQVRTLVTDKGMGGWGMNHWKADQVQKFQGAKVSDLFDLDTSAIGDAWMLDIPLHDLVANILGVPVYELLGARGPNKILLYSGSIYMEDVWPRDDPKGIPAVLRSCKTDYDLGYRAFKLKIGRGYKHMPKKEGLRRDIEVTRAVRERFSDCKICVDGNNGLPVAEMIEYVKGIADADLFFIEEPFQENRDDLKRLREAMLTAGCKAMICEGEARSEGAKERWRYGGYSKAHIDRLFKLAEENLVDIFNTDLGTVGFTNWRRTMPELMEAGVKSSPHTWAWTPRTYYSAQLGAGVGNVVIAEGIPGGAPEIDYSAYRFDARGNVIMPEVPGFGLRLKT
jgi:L-alanine-DL-glutamate epimerase-like enolase superfamily enzyme